jgi:hypothetical protein
MGWLSFLVRVVAFYRFTHTNTHTYAPTHTPTQTHTNYCTPNLSVSVHEWDSDVLKIYDVIVKMNSNFSQVLPGLYRQTNMVFQLLIIVSRSAKDRIKEKCHFQFSVMIETQLIQGLHPIREHIDHLTMSLES